MIKPITSIKSSLIIGLIAISSISSNAQNDKKKIIDKSDEISYEHNQQLDKRIGYDYLNQAQIDEMYKKLGTYGASIELQRLKGDYITNIVHPVTDNIPESKIWDVYDKCFNQFPSAVKEYIEHSRATTAENLYKNGVPTAKECSNYLEKEFVNDGSLSNNDYAKYKKDIRRFKKAQGNVITNQSVAELIAYKQFKLDSIAYRKLLNSFGFLSNPEVKRLFEKGTFSKIVAPEPTVSE